LNVPNVQHFFFSSFTLPLDATEPDVRDVRETFEVSLREDHMDQQFSPPPLFLCRMKRRRKKIKQIFLNV
jgi:hypothetical protein